MSCSEEHGAKVQNYFEKRCADGRKVSFGQQIFYKDAVLAKSRGADLATAMCSPNK